MKSTSNKDFNTFLYLEYNIRLKPTFIIWCNRYIDILKHRKVEEKYLAEQSYAENSEFFQHRIMEEEIYVLLEKAVSALPEQTSKVLNFT